MTDETKPTGGIFAYIMLQLGERSTWRGLVDFATAAGLLLKPDQIEAIITAGVSLRAAIAVFLPDKTAAAAAATVAKARESQL